MKIMKTLLKVLGRSISHHRFLYILCLLLGGISELLVLVQPQLGGKLIEGVQSGQLSGSIVAELVFILASNALVTMCQQLVLGKICEDSAYELRCGLVERFFSLPILEQESKAPGWYSQRIVSDVDLTKALPGQSIALFQATIILIGSTIALLCIEPITFFVGASFGVLSLVFAVIASRPLVKLREGIQDAYTGITAGAQESMRTGRVLRAYGAWNASRKELELEVSRAHEDGLRLSVINSCLFPIASILMQLANIGTILFGAFRVADGAIAFSGLVMFLMYFSAFSSSVSQLSGSISRMREAEAGERRLTELETMNVERSIRYNHQIPNIISGAAEIQFNNVSFSYDGETEFALKDASFIVPAGKRTAIVGASGGGKTTCLGLLEKFFFPNSGEILLNGMPLNEIETSRLRASIGYVDQDAVVMRGTIRSNLSVGREGISDSEMEKVLDLVGLTLPQPRLDYQTGENGSALSGGQKQRLALARSFLGLPNLLIMDEPTSSLDGIAEHEINDIIRKAFSSITVLCTAHRLSQILSSDWIVVVNEGQVVAQGPHEILMDTCEYYRELVASQAA